MTNHFNPVNDLILLFSLTFALYHIGHIWPFQVVLFSLWRRVGAKEFPAYHETQFRSIFGVIFVPLGLSALAPRRRRCVTGHFASVPFLLDTAPTPLSAREEPARAYTRTGECPLDASS
jgi:hypothetical protein